MPINAPHHTLVAYFSWAGNTRKVAERIATVYGATLFAIETTHNYPTELTACVEVSHKEKDADIRPELTQKVEDMSQYDVVFVGFPNWCGTAPMAVWTFLESYDFTGKTLIPFITHGKGGRQQCFDDFARHVGTADIRSGFSCKGAEVDASLGEVDKWLEGLAL